MGYAAYHAFNIRQAIEKHCSECNSSNERGRFSAVEKIITKLDNQSNSGGGHHRGGNNNGLIRNQLKKEQLVCSEKSFIRISVKQNTTGLTVKLLGYLSLKHGSDCASDRKKENANRGDDDVKRLRGLRQCLTSIKTVKGMRKTI